MITLDPEVLNHLLSPDGTLYVAFSGGVDSQVLLHCAMTQLPDEMSQSVRALHVHHGLSEYADDWLQHCRRVCEVLDVPLLTEWVEVVRSGSLEEQARRARYEVFARYLKDGDVLLQGHHANDQAETVLFRLERGTGLRGLQGIPTTRPLGQGMLWRPLLSCSRLQIEDYARAHRLDWVEDDSNSDLHYRRNFLRHTLLTPWQQDNPAVATQIAASVATVQTEMSVVQRLLNETLQGYLHADGSLQLAPLMKDERAFWIARYLHSRELSLTQAQLSAVTKMFYSQAEKQPVYQGDGYRLARFLRRLYVLPQEQDVTLGRLEAGQWYERAFDNIYTQSPLVMKARPSGVRLQLANGMHRSLKKWLQDQAIPPWWREHLPYLYEGDKLVAIADLWVHPDWNGQVIWQPSGELPFVR